LFIAFSPGSGDGIVDEIEQAAARFDGGSQVLINPSVGALERELSVSRPLVHIAGHAGIDPVQGALAWLETPGGRLTSRDLIRMRFRADTIVVTGCHTARRTISAGDEWLGLMRAFYLSGARTVVSAHWAIRDESARLFSANFYEAYDPLSPETAVRAGTRAIRNQFPHPYFWAGFGTFIRKRGGCST
jgi:CHAT domain-containing protein